ncbi:general odorant-binding protein 56a [Drosophila pseudoobscura]|uniref:General odorant-binding protein 56a n=1 Tax=Drosophila pseudoobscura pseudoobscura TaxID=46245 RepID=A0A6I8UVH3_DROPS|nr:general odorant-binding protein 56a [Drosophila pseudoobscura]
MNANCLVIALILGLALYEPVASQSAADLAAFKQNQESCIKELKIGAAEAALLTTDKEVANPSEAVKCYHSCLYKKLGMLTADSKPINDMIMKFAQLRFSSLASDKVKALLTSCGASKAATTCDFVYNFERCVVKGAKA